MNKKVFSIAYLVMCCFVFICIESDFLINDKKILLSENREKKIEEAFPFKSETKEIYGFSNRLLSPNEKITGYSATIRDKDGYLEQIVTVKDIDLNKQKIRELNDVCHDAGCEFAYISYPSKTNSKTIATEYGIDTNADAVRKDFLQYLENEGIDYLDIRSLLERDGYCTKDIFYKTDHHWKTTAGFYAARAIASFLNENFGYHLDVNALDEEKFRFTTYNDLWFGETGRSLSRAWVNALDDFTEIVPKYDTSISIYQSDGRGLSGDFNIMLDKSGYTTKDVDYYSYSAHYAYGKNMCSPTTYHNNFATKDGEKILIIKDSFSIVVIPFLILETVDVTVWDMREENTKKGLYEYINNNDFDVVLLAYTDYWSDFMWNFN